MMRRGVDTADNNNNTDANNNKDKDNNNNNNANGCQIIMDEEEEEEDATMRLRRREDEEEDAMLRPSAPTPRRFKEERLPLETVHALRELTRGSEERRDNNNINEEEDGEATGGGWTSLRVPAGFLSCQVAEDDNNNEEDAGADGKKRQRRSWLDHIDSTQVAHAIIKNKAADDRLHVLAIARRLRYCLDA